MTVCSTPSCLHHLPARPHPSTLTHRSLLPYVCPAPRYRQASPPTATSSLLPGSQFIQTVQKDGSQLQIYSMKPVSPTHTGPILRPPSIDSSTSSAPKNTLNRGASVNRTASVSKRSVFTNADGNPYSRFRLYRRGSNDWPKRQSRARRKLASQSCLCRRIVV